MNLDLSIYEVKSILSAMSSSIELTNGMSAKTAFNKLLEVEKEYDDHIREDVEGEGYESQKDYEESLEE